jgi:hypothetical protein
MQQYTVHFWRSETPDSGLKVNKKKRWHWLYDALIILCVVSIVAEPQYLTRFLSGSTVGSAKEFGANQFLHLYDRKIE